MLLHKISQISYLGIYQAFLLASFAFKHKKSINYVSNKPETKFGFIAAFLAIADTFSIIDKTSSSTSEIETSTGIVPKDSSKSFLSTFYRRKMSLKDVINKSDDLYENGKYKDSHKILESFPDQKNVQIMWREARSFYKFAKASSDKSSKRKFLSNGVDKLKEALKIDEKSAEAHCWMAILLLTYIDCDGMMSALKYLDKAHIHAKKANELGQNNPWTWFTLAAYEFELADLPWVQRKLVFKVFTDTPNVSYEKSLAGFQQAEKVNPGFYVTNWLMMAKCLVALKRYEEAKTYLQRTANCTVRNEDDKASKEAAEKLLKDVTVKCNKHASSSTPR